MNARQRQRYAAKRQELRDYFRDYHRRREALIRAGKWQPARSAES